MTWDNLISRLQSAVVLHFPHRMVILHYLNSTVAVGTPTAQQVQRHRSPNRSCLNVRVSNLEVFHALDVCRCQRQRGQIQLSNKTGLPILSRKEQNDRSEVADNQVLRPDAALRTPVNRSTESKTEKRERKEAVKEAKVTFVAWIFFDHALSSSRFVVIAQISKLFAFIWILPTDHFRCLAEGGTSK